MKNLITLKNFHSSILFLHRLILFGVFVIIFFQFSGLKCKIFNREDPEYELHNLFEKPIANNYADSSLYLQHSNSQYRENYCTLIEHSSPMIPDILSPGLLAIDGAGNYYISNAHENVKIFDRAGNFVYIFKFPEKVEGIFSSIDAQDNFFMFFTIRKAHFTDSVVYRINVSNKTSVILKTNEKSELDKSILPPEDFNEIITRKKAEHGKNGIYYEIIPSATKIKTIFKNKDGRFIYPEQLIVYKVDDSYDYNQIIPDDKYLFTKLNIPDLCTDKVVYICTFESDEDGNILISGTKTNETEQTKIDNIDAVRANNLKFFIWKFQRK